MMHASLRFFLFLGFLLPLTLFSSCGPDYAYERTYELDNATWSYEDTLTFAFEVPDTAAIYNLYLDLEHATDYPNQNLYVQIHTDFPSGDRLTEEVSLELSEKGRWQGDCGSERCRLRIPIQTGAYFDQIGTHRFVLEQYMRRNPVEGIASIAMRIENTGERR